MRNPRPEDFDPKLTKRRADNIDLKGIVPIHPMVRRSPAEQFVHQAKGNEKMVSSHRDTTIPGHHDTTVSSQIDVFQGIRKAVKEFGKEAATHRFTQAEKQALADLVYSYRSRGIRTSENEIARIAINYLIHDYQVNGKSSILHGTLLSLNE